MQGRNQNNHTSNENNHNNNNNNIDNILNPNYVEETDTFNMPDEASDENRCDLLNDDATEDDDEDDDDAISEDDGGQNNPGVNPNDQHDFVMADADGVEDTSMQHQPHHGAGIHDSNPNAAQVPIPAAAQPLASRDGPSLVSEGGTVGGVVLPGEQQRRQAAQAQGGAGQQLQQQRTNTAGAGGGNNDAAGAAEQPEMDDEPPLDGYERTDRIGQGAYGIVYRGIQRSTGSTVAIKRIPFAEATPEGGVPCNVIREISLLRELDHPNVVRLLDVNQAQPGELYLVFEFVAFDLKTFMDQQQSSTAVSERVGLPPSTVKNFMRQILQGVGFCHTYRVLHRDLKPHNLLISQDGTQLKLADFGLARLSGLPNGPYTYEVVTLWYRAPELLLGASRYSTAVDMWSVGCIFAEMATGLPLFPGRSDIDQLFKIFQRRGTPTAEVWPNYPRLPYFNADFPQWRPRPVTDLISSSMGRSTASASANASGGSMADSPHAMDLLEQILQYDPDRRLVCKTALQHPYFFGQ